MYNEQLEQLIDAALADGVLTEKEKQILFKKAQTMGIDLDEFEMVLDARLVKLKKAEADAAAPKSTKYGDVRKCPSCGAMIPSLAVVCPECGYEISGIDANLSSRKLYTIIDGILNDASEKKNELQKGDKSGKQLKDAIDEIDSDAKDRIRNAIKNFAIPNTKNDLFEFVTFLQPKVEDYNYGDEYYQKLEECIEKIKILFPKDPIFDEFLKRRQQKIDEKNNKIKKKKKIFYLVCLPLGVLLTLLDVYLVQFCLDLGNSTDDQATKGLLYIYPSFIFILIPYIYIEALKKTKV